MSASRYLSDWWNVITWLNYGLFAYNMLQFFAVGAKVPKKECLLDGNAARADSCTKQGVGRCSAGQLNLTAAIDHTADLVCRARLPANLTGARTAKFDDRI